jgi:hypothetical protein
MMTMDTTQHQQVVAGVAWLAQLDFTTGTLYVTTAPQNLTVGANTYTGLGSLVSVAQLNESADSGAEKITLSLSVANTAMLALAIGAVETYRGRAVRLYLQLFDEQFKRVGNPVQRWSGSMDRVQINRRPADPGSSGAGGGSIDLQCSRAGMARARNFQGQRLTDVQQRIAYPGDTGLRYVRKLIEEPTPWLTVAFQRR